MRIVVEQKGVGEENDTTKRDRFMQMLLFKAISEIKQYMSSGIFKHPTGALMNSVNGYIIADEIIIYSDKRYARSQEFGVEPHAMWYLVGKTVPIKIFHPHVYEPETIFRRVTAEAISKGKWHHPGYPGKFFMRTGIDRAMQQAPEIRKKIYAGETVFI